MNKKLLNNKKGEVVLRDIMIMLVIFAGVIALSSMFVKNMAGPNAYDNAQMILEYNNLGIGNLGDTMINSNLTPTITGKMLNQTQGSGGTISSFVSITGIVTGAGAILLEVVKAPSYVGTAVSSMLTSTGIIDYDVQKLISNIINLLIYIVIIFVIISSLLKGGRM